MYAHSPDLLISFKRFLFLPIANCKNLKIEMPKMLRTKTRLIIFHCNTVKGIVMYTECGSFYSHSKTDSYCKATFISINFQEVVWVY